MMMLLMQSRAADFCICLHDFEFAALLIKKEDY